MSHTFFFLFNLLIQILTFDFIQSGARVLISDGSTPERIVTITGTTNAICKATELIGQKVEEVSTSILLYNKIHHDLLFLFLVF